VFLRQYTSTDQKEPPRNEPRPTRFKPDETDGAFVSYNDKNPKAPKYPALLINESYGGAALALVIDAKPNLGEIITVKAGHLDPMKAKVAWIKNIPNETIWKMGIQYLE